MTTTVNYYGIDFDIADEWYIIPRDFECDIAIGTLFSTECGGSTSVWIRVYAGKTLILTAVRNDLDERSQPNNVVMLSRLYDALVYTTQYPIYRNRAFELIVKAFCSSDVYAPSFYAELLEAAAVADRRIISGITQARSNGDEKD